VTESNAAGADDRTPGDGGLWDQFRRTAAGNPDAAAVVDTRRGRFTYGELREHVTGLAGALAAAGVENGDRFATLLGNGVEGTAALLVASRLGATVATVDHRHSVNDVAHILADCDASLVVFDEGTRPVLEAVREDLAVERFLYAGEDSPAYADAYWEEVAAGADVAPPAPDLAPDDPIYLPYTSGTTGRPKGCLHTADMAELVRAVTAEFGLADERLLSVVPQAHAMGGWFGGTMPVLVGGTVVTIPAFEPVNALETIAAESVTSLIAVPALLRMLVAVEPERFDTASLSTVISAGAPLAPELATEVDGVFELAGFYNAMGATEVGWLFTRDVRDDLAAARSPGIAAPNVDTRIVRPTDGDGGDPTEECVVGEAGELIVDSPYSMARYVGSPDGTTDRFRDVSVGGASAASGETGTPERWSYTGDLGYVDGAGQFWPEGRRANVITAGDITVSDVHVEEVLHEHPDIAAVGVVGVPDDRRGERVVACVVPADSPVTENLIEWAREQPALGTHERPREVVFFEDLPRSATMAVRKFALRDQLTPETDSP
jgi:acyl-coenzyme A synthetase/AMP-(fatty) acid ligase